MTTLEDKTWARHYAKEKIIAIDPGKAGGIAVYSVPDGAVIALTSMLDTPTDLFNFLKRSNISYIFFCEISLRNI